MTHPGATTLHAWVDESVHTARGTAPEGLYLLAATIADPAVCEPVRVALRGQLTGNERRWHRRTETRARRIAMAEVIAECGLPHTVIIGTPLDEHRQERARRICMERLYFELYARDVSMVWVESRHESLNRRDREMVDALRAKGAIGTSSRVEFALPREEPMLWLPDAVAGAVGAFRKGGESLPWHLLARTVEEISIRLT